MSMQVFSPKTSVNSKAATSSNIDPDSVLEQEWMRDSISLRRVKDRNKVTTIHPLRQLRRRAAFAVRRRGGHVFTYLAVSNMTPTTPIPPPRKETINLVPYGQVDKRIPLRHLFVADRIPQDEQCKLEPAIFSFQRIMAKLVPTNAQDIPAISEDLDANVRRSVPKYFFNLPWVSRPQTPTAIKQSPNDVLGAIALAGPFAAYIQREEGTDKYIIDLTEMAKYSVKDHLAHLGFKATLRYDASAKQMVTDTIELPAENKRVSACDSNAKEWQRAQRIALASLSTHMTAVRHLAWTHISVGEAFAAITATHLSADNPVHTILHPHNFRTTATNKYRVPSLISDETSALPTVFSYKRAQMLELLDDAAKNFDLSRLDPIVDAQRRGMLDAPVDYPYLGNVGSIWNTMQVHVRDYIETHYKSDEDIRGCPQLQNWYAALNQVRGAQAYAGPLGIEALVRLITVVMYTASIEHENVGNLVVNYTTLPQIPSNVRLDGTLPSEAEYQEYMNLLLLTSTPFDPLLGNNYPGMSAKGAAVMTRMCDALQAEDDKLQSQGPLPLSVILAGKCAVSAAT